MRSVSLDSWADQPPSQGPPPVDVLPASTGGSGAPSPAIHVVELSKRYRRTAALRGLSMTVPRGEIFGFLGPNGAGKTTTVKLLLGLTKPTGGDALVLGAPVGDVETRRHVGYLPELFRFQSWLTSSEVLHLHWRLLQLPTARRDATVRDALAEVGLADRRDDRVGSYSKGMQQRLGLAVALLGEPQLVILDEPTSALDPVGRHDVREIIRTMKSRGTTVFLNTHLLEEAQHVCDRVTVMDKGRAVVTGPLPELLKGRASVRLRVEGLAGEWWRGLSSFGDWSVDGTWCRVDGAGEDSVPELVASVVRLGGRIQAVVPETQSLEERFLQVLGQS